MNEGSTEKKEGCVRHILHVYLEMNGTVSYYVPFNTQNNTPFRTIFPSWLSRQRAGCKPLVVSLRKDLDDIFPKPPCSLCGPLLLERNPIFKKNIQGGVISCVHTVIVSFRRDPKIRFPGQDYMRFKTDTMYHTAATVVLVVGPRNRCVPQPIQSHKTVS